MCCRRDFSGQLWRSPRPSTTRKRPIFSYENMWATVIYTNIWNDGNCSLDRLVQLAWFSAITKVRARPWECKKKKQCKWNLLDENSIHLTCLTDYSPEDWNTIKIVVSVYKAGHQEKCFNIKIIIISAETLIFDQLCNLSLFKFEGPFKSISEPREGNVTWYHPENTVTPARSVRRTHSVGRALVWRAKGRRLDSRCQTNTQGLKITEKWRYYLAWLGWPRKMAVPCTVGDVKMVSSIRTLK